MANILSLIFCVIVFWILWRKRRFTLFQRCGIPGPKPNFWNGNLNEFSQKRDECAEDWVKKYGKFVGFYLGAKPMVICTDTEFLKIMQIKEFKNFVNKDLILPDGGLSHKIIFKAIILLRDQEWKNARKFLNTSFSIGKIKKMSPIITETINIFLKKIQETKGESFDILISFKKLIFDIISRISLGVITDVQTNKTSKFTQSVYDAFTVDFLDFLPSISVCFPEIEPIPTKLRSLIDVCKYLLNRPSARVIMETCTDIIKSRKKLEQKQDLLQSMIDANLSETKVFSKYEDVLSNAMAFMLAGYDPTNHTLGYCAHLLATHPDAQEKTRAEINMHIKKENDVQYTDLTNFQYLEQVIFETLRLYPLAFSVINRICTEDFKYNGMIIPKGATVIAPMGTLHKDPAYWTEPEKFIPERFSPENRINIDPFVYQPFGSGPRMCIGMKLAMIILKFVLANLIRFYKLESTQEEKELHLEYTLFIIRPKNGILVKAIPL